MKMPKTVYVRIEKDSNGRDEFLLVSTEPEGGNREKIGVYVLKEIKTMKIAESLE